MSTLVERLEKVVVALEELGCPGAAFTVRQAIEELTSAAENLQWIAALECAGVDNWEGCEEAHALLREWEEDAAKST